VCFSNYYFGAVLGGRLLDESFPGEGVQQGGEGAEPDSGGDFRDCGDECGLFGDELSFFLFRYVDY
jgi:hypothetical protein